MTIFNLKMTVKSGLEFLCAPSELLLSGQDDPVFMTDFLELSCSNSKGAGRNWKKI